MHSHMGFEPLVKDTGLENMDKNQIHLGMIQDCQFLFCRYSKE